jgi:hypothetical protein
MLQLLGQQFCPVKEDSMPPRLRTLFLALLAALFCIPAVTLFNALSRRADIWWTPAPLALSLADSKDRVEIYARGQSLDRLVQQNRLSIMDGRESRVITAPEIGLRFNNWDRVRAARLPLLLVCAAACGATALLFVLVATNRLAYRGENDAVAA